MFAVLALKISVEVTFCAASSSGISGNFILSRNNFVTKIENAVLEEFDIYY